MGLFTRSTVREPLDVQKLLAILIIAFVMIKLAAMIATGMKGGDITSTLAGIDVIPLFNILLIGGAVLIAYGIIQRKASWDKKDAIILIIALTLLYFIATKAIPNLLGKDMVIMQSIFT